MGPRPYLETRARPRARLSSAHLANELVNYAIGKLGDDPRCRREHDRSLETATEILEFRATRVSDLRGAEGKRTNQFLR